MNPIVFLFIVIAVGFAISKVRRSPETAVVAVFLPVLLFVPATLELAIRHLPPVSCMGLVLLPIGIAAVVSRHDRWQFKRADLWVLLYVLASFYTNYLNLGLVTALYILPSAVLESLFAYLVGKLLIEQGGIREKFVQRMTTLLAAIGFIAILEFALRKNIFLMIASKILRFDSGDAYAFRGGFTRIAGPFAGAEQAGIMFMFGFLLSLWIWFINRFPQKSNEPKFLGLRRSTVCVLGNLLGLGMAQSRGPWMGAAAGLLLAYIGLAKNRRLAMVLTLILATIGGVLVNQKRQQYAHIDLNTATEQEMSAEYRTHLFEIYKPIAEQGGLFGWSAAAFPRDPHFGSIDNEYILLWVVNGSVGLTLFTLIAAEGVLAIGLAVRRSRQRIDSCFDYCLWGMMIGLMLVLSTVWLAGQSFVLFFLFVGWSQSLRDQQREDSTLPQTQVSRFAFRRVFV